MVATNLVGIPNCPEYGRTDRLEFDTLSRTKYVFSYRALVLSVYARQRRGQADQQGQCDSLTTHRRHVQLRPSTHRPLGVAWRAD